MEIVNMINNIDFITVLVIILIISGLIHIYGSTIDIVTNQKKLMEENNKLKFQLETIQTKLNDTNDKLHTTEEHILIEIACLATKNNHDLSDLYSQLGITEQDKEESKNKTAKHSYTIDFPKPKRR